MTGRVVVVFALVVLASQGPRLGAWPDGGEGTGLVSDELAEPIPLRRLKVSVERLAEEMRRQGDGEFVRRGRGEFEELVRAAARAVVGRRKSPRLLEARYRATLMAVANASGSKARVRADSDGERGVSTPRLAASLTAPHRELMLVGSAEWKVNNPKGGPALLPLAGLNLAIRSSRFENRDAFLADVPEGTSLFVDEPGEHTVTLEWSSRAEARPDGIHVQLQLPECPTAVLELELPSGHSVITSPGNPVAGPTRAERPDRQLWTIGCGGRSSLALVIRHVQPDRPAILFATQRAVQKIAADGVHATHTFTINTLQQDLTELLIHLDERLRPLEVTGADIEGWEFASGERDVSTPQVLNIKTTRPVRELTFQLTAVGPLGGLSWESPSVTVVGAVPRGETLELWLHAGLVFNAWKPGDFRLTDSTSRPGDAYRVLTLQGGAIADNGERGVSTPRWAVPMRRPRLELRAAAVTFHTSQQMVWRLDTDSHDLQCQTEYMIHTGELFQLSLELPTGWTAETVDLSPPDLLRSWAVREQKPTTNSTRRVSVLNVELRRPARPEMTPVLTLRLRPVQAGLPIGPEMPFPDVRPLGGRYRDTDLAILTNQSLYDVKTRCPVSPSDAPADGFWGRKTPERFYSFDNEPVTGSLRLISRVPLTRSRGEVFVAPSLTLPEAMASGALTHPDSPPPTLPALTGDHRRPIEVEYKITVEAESGRPDTVDVFIPPTVVANNGERGLSTPRANANPSWHWRTQTNEHRITSAPAVADPHRAALAPLAARSPLECLSLLVTPGFGSCWRITFQPPLVPRRPVVLRSTQRLDASLGRCVVPLPAVSGLFEGQVTLPSGMVPVLPVDEVPTGLYRYGPGPRQLTVRDNRPSRTPEPETLEPAGRGATIEEATLTTWLHSDGSQRHEYAFTLSHWTAQTLTVQLPATARLISARLHSRWLDLPEEPTLHLPVPVSGSARYRLNYATAGLTGLGFRLADPLPVLPVGTLGLKRLWHLPPGVRPLLDGVARQVPGRSWSAEVPWRQPTDLLQLGTTSTSRDSIPEERKQALADASAGIPRRPGAKLASVVQSLVNDYLRDVHPLVVDTVALAEVGRGPQSTINLTDRRGSPPDPGLNQDSTPWQALGLELVAMPSGVLLTLHGRPRDDSAVARAVTHGRDSSGCYVAAVEWLTMAGGVYQRPDEASGVYQRSDSPTDGWSTWEPVAGFAEDGSLLVIRSSRVSAVGLGLAAIFILFILGDRGVSTPRSTAVRLRGLVGLLAILGFALAWLPTSLLDVARWPFLAGLLVGLPLILLTEAKTSGVCQRPDSPSPSTKSSLSSIAVAIVPVVLLLLGADEADRRPVASSSPSPEERVYLLDGPPPEVLVSPSLIRRLEVMVRDDSVQRLGAVLTQANYEGRLSGTMAEFDATYIVYSFTESTTAISLPLDGVSIVGDVLLDGSRVFPRALPAGQIGYRVAVKGAGTHKLQLRFRVPSTLLGDESAGVRQLRCGIPRVVQSRLVFKGSPSVTQLLAASKWGGQFLAWEGDAEQLDADLGPTSNLLLRWLQKENSPAGNSQLPLYREAYWWDLQPQQCTLNGLLHYTFNRRAGDTIAIRIPPGLEVLAVDARRPRGSVDVPIRLCDWLVSAELGGATPPSAATNPEGPTNPKERLLRLEFSGPLYGEVEIEFQLAPRVPLSGSTLFPLPRPEGQTQVTTPGYLAYRLSGLDATRSTQGLTGIVPTRFASDWPLGERPAVADLTAAFTFRRQSGAAPVLRLELRPRSDPLEVAQDIQVSVGPRRADFSARLEVAPSAVSLATLEWDIGPGVMVSEVQGQAIARWTQTDSRLLVWLERTTGPIEIRVTGWTILKNQPSKSGGVHADRLVDGAGKNPAQLARLELPCLRPIGGTARTTLKVEAEPGLVLTTPVLNGLKPTSDATFIATSQSYRGTFALGSEALSPVRVVTRGRLEGSLVIFNSRVEYQTTTPREASARLRDWPGHAQLEVDPARIRSRREWHRRSPDTRERLWKILTRPENGLHFDIISTTSADETDLSVPDVQPLGAITERIVVIEPSLFVESTRGASAVPAPAGVVTGSLAYRLTAGNSTIRVSPRRKPGGAATLLTEVSASLADRQLWLHDVTWWLKLDSPTELTAVLPSECRFVSLTVDGKPMVPNQRHESAREARELGRGEREGLSRFPTKTPLTLSLADSGTRRVRLRYYGDKQRESLTHPDLTPPRLEGVPPGPVLWTVYVPSGWSPSALSPTPLSASLGQAWRDLSRADVLRNSPEATGLLRSAALALESQSEDEPHGPDGLPLSRWLARLRDQIGSTERTTSLPAPEPHGCPVRWSSGVDRIRAANVTDAISSDAAPKIHLVPDTAGSTLRALGATAQWSVGWLTIWLITQLALLQKISRFLWPEVLVVLGVVGALLAGLTPVVWAAMGVGLAARLLIGGRAITQWLTARELTVQKG